MHKRKLTTNKREIEINFHHKDFIGPKESKGKIIKKDSELYSFLVNFRNFLMKKNDNLHNLKQDFNLKIYKNTIKDNFETIKKLENMIIDIYETKNYKKIGKSFVYLLLYKNMKFYICIYFCDKTLSIKEFLEQLNQFISLSTKKPKN